MRFGDMTPVQQREAVGRAARQLEAELARTAPAIAAILDDVEDQPEHTPHDVTELGYTTTRCAVCGGGLSPWPCAVERERIAKANGTWVAEDWS